MEGKTSGWQDSLLNPTNTKYAMEVCSHVLVSIRETNSTLNGDGLRECACAAWAIIPEYLVLGLLVVRMVPRQFSLSTLGEH